MSILCGLYGLVLYWRRPRTMLRVWFLVTAGAALAAAVLLTQLTAYMGWENVKEDVRLTLTARNASADTTLLEQVTSFYRDHKIIFWHNFMDATPLRNPGAFVKSLFHFHLQFYTPLAVFIALLVGVGWLLGLLRWPGWIEGRNTSARPVNKWLRHAWLGPILVAACLAAGALWAPNR